METIRQKISLKEYCQTAAADPAITPFEFGDSVINWNVLYKYFMGVDLKGDFLTLVQRAELVKFGQLLCGESWYHDVIAINPDETGDDLLCDDAREWISKAIAWLTETSDSHLALIEIYASKLADLKALLDVKRTQSRTGENVTASHRTGENVTADQRGGEINRTSNDTDENTDAPDTEYIPAESETHISGISRNTHSEKETPTDTTTTTETPNETNTTTETPNETLVTSEQRDTLMKRINEVQNLMKNIYEEWVRDFERVFLLPPEMYY